LSRADTGAAERRTFRKRTRPQEYTLVAMRLFPLKFLGSRRDMHPQAKDLSQSEIGHAVSVKPRERRRSKAVHATLISSKAQVLHPPGYAPYDLAQDICSTTTGNYGSKKTYQIFSGNL